jgi:hypothetical protein
MLKYHIVGTKEYYRIKILSLLTEVYLKADFQCG